MFALHAPRPAPASPLPLAPDLCTLELASPAPVLTEIAAATLPRYWPTSSGDPFYQVSSAVQGGVFSFCRGLPGSEPSGVNYSEEKVVTSSSSGARAPLGQQWSFFHEGDVIELEIRNNPEGFLIRIDNRFVSLDPYESTGQVIVRLEFATVARRRIDIISWNLNFSGLYTGPNDGLYAADIRGPRTLVYGDSFTTPEPTNWSFWFAHAMGWDDVWSSGIGGTGFIADNFGVSLPLTDRVMTDIVPYRPEVVFIHAGINDLLQDLTALEAAVAQTVRQIRDNLPETLVVGGMDNAFGVEAWLSTELDRLDAVRSGFLSAGGTWITPLEMPFEFGGEPIGAQASLQFAVSQGNPGNDGTPDAVSYPNGFTCVTATNTPLANLRVGSTVEIGTGATRERVLITSVGFVSGRLVYGFDGTMRYAHAAGEPVREVAPCFVTGRDANFSTSGWGTAINYVGADGYHYTPEGHRALGAANASLMRHALRGRPLI